MKRSLVIHTPHGALHANLSIPLLAHGLIIVATVDNALLDMALTAQLATRQHALLSINLLTEHESQFPDSLHNVPHIAQRLLDVLDFVRRDGDLEHLQIGILASQHATPAAVRAAAQRDLQVRALVCHGGLIDLAGLQNLKFLSAPLLMLVDHGDQATLTAFRRAAHYLGAAHELHALETGENPIARVAAWFDSHLMGSQRV